MLAGAVTSWRLLTTVCFAFAANSQAAGAYASGAALQGRVGPAPALRLFPEHPHRAGPRGTPAADASVQQ